MLFDSGDTLIRPVGGRWNPRFDFEEIVLRHLPELAVASFPPAFAVGQKLLDAGPATPSLADYHLAILHPLGVRRPPPRLLWELEQPGTRPLVEPFPEVPAVLERLPSGSESGLWQAEAEFQGVRYAPCWRRHGEAVHLLYEDGDMGLLPASTLRRVVLV